MDTKKAGAAALGALLVVSIIPFESHNDHVETIQGQQDEAMLMDAAIISTHSGTAPTLGDLVARYPGRTDFI